MEEIFKKRPLFQLDHFVPQTLAAMMKLIALLLLMNVTWPQALANGSHQALGTAVDISKVQIGTMTLPKGHTIFKSDPFECMLELKNLGKSGDEKEYYMNTQEMIRQFGLSAGLSASFLSVASLGASISGTFQNSVGTTSSLNGYKHTHFTHTNKKYLDINCLRKLELDENFERDFKILERKINHPERRESWLYYDIFMKKYGTHYVSEITYGASVTQYLSAESSYHHTERDFKIKACLDVTVPVKVGLIKAGPCGGYSRKRYSSRSFAGITDRFVVLGGTPETRNKIQSNPTLEYIEKLKNEGHWYKAPVSYKFNSIADLLLKRFGSTRYLNQVKNLEAYVEGFVNFNCAYKMEHNIELQKFELQPYSRFPQYMCTLAPEGCSQDSDCNFRGTCKCRGNTCVRYHQMFPMRKTTAMINDSTEPGKIDKYCQVSWFNCKCKRPRYERRKIVWKTSNRKKRRNTQVKIMASQTTLH